MPGDVVDGKSTRVQLMVWGRQYQNRYWSRYLTPYGVTSEFNTLRKKLIFSSARELVQKMACNSAVAQKIADLLRPKVFKRNIFHSAVSSVVHNNLLHNINKHLEISPAYQRQFCPERHILNGKTVCVMTLLW